VVSLELLLARSDRAAVCITRLAGYPTGFGFDALIMLARSGEEEELDPLLFGPHRRRGRRNAGELPPELLRLGVQFADGRKATNLSGVRRDLGAEEPTGPVMVGGGGGGGGGTWNQHQWVWPLPPPGPLVFACEWPAAGIPLTRHEIEAQAILDAARRAQVIFSEEDLPEQPGGSFQGAMTQAIIRGD
jgi:hypothetical protein